MRPPTSMASQVSAEKETEALGWGETGSRWDSQEGVGPGLEPGLGLPSFCRDRGEPGIWG